MKKNSRTLRKRKKVVYTEPGDEEGLNLTSSESESEEDDQQIQSSEKNSPTSYWDSDDSDDENDGQEFSLKRVTGIVGVTLSSIVFVASFLFFC